MKFILICVTLLLLQQCDRNHTNPNPSLDNKTLIETLQKLPASFIEKTMLLPTAEGALDRNIPDYFHVRFQVGVATQGAYAVYFKNEQALYYLAASIQYSFNYQKPAGDFEVKVPESLQNQKDPEPSDLVSGVAFFGAALGEALMMIKSSDWYQNLPASQIDKKTIEDHRDQIKSMLRFLQQEKQTLIAVDSNATNRLFWDAVCFYSLGAYLNDEAAMQTGIDFLNIALSNQRSAGFFLENGGYDSSYNGVSLYLATVLYTLLPAGSTKEMLSDALVRCSAWQMSRILNSGEISVEGNTRVHPGGEVSFGDEKKAAWKDTVLGLYWLNRLSGYSDYKEKADLVLKFYG